MIEEADMALLNISFDTPQRQNYLNNIITNQENDVFLGRGSYGCVYTALYKGRKVAVKIIPKNDEARFSSFRHEQNVLKFNHPNLIKIFKIVETKESGAMIMERFAQAKSLQWILDHLKKKLNLSLRLKILKDISNGVSFCHENKIIHMDLKPDNIMVVGDNKNNFICKLFDFGCSHLFNEKLSLNDHSGGGSYKNLTGTIRYSAPELLQGLKPNFAIDVFSIGIIMWQMKENEIPYHSIKSNDIIAWQVVKNNLRPDSTLLLLTELNESIRLYQPMQNFNQFCKSNEFLQIPINKSSTPVSFIIKHGKVAHNSLSRSDFKRDKAIKLSESSNLRSIKKLSRRNLFDSCKSINLLMNIENDQNASDENYKNLLNLFDNDYHSPHKELFQIENEYIRLYKACWDKNFNQRPNIKDICNTLKKLIDYF
ncbi:hypothetical protein PVAND_010351 [Polypedilum vanderplanki]|uniref:Protein kinase domain-containing protein n=1 Tax=Polypedilum vanderplanki TaxID=319348 RepID=A0A9J6CH04_POLVA|nr:hypothetical protein PVAND_010351 [Polypedilum vanderplanki]